LKDLSLWLLVPSFFLICPILFAEPPPRCLAEYQNVPSCRDALTALCPDADLEDKWVLFLCAIEQTPQLPHDCKKVVQTDCESRNTFPWYPNERSHREELTPPFAQVEPHYYRISQSDWVTYSIDSPYPAQNIVSKLQGQMKSFGWRSVFIGPDGQWHQLTSQDGRRITIMRRLSWLKGNNQVTDYYLEYSGTPNNIEEQKQGKLHVFGKLLQM